MSKITYDPGSSMLCQKHWQPVYDEKLSQVGLQMELIKIFMWDKRIIDFANRHNSHEAAEVYNDALSVYKPICCFLGDERVNGVYEVLRNIKKRTR